MDRDKRRAISENRVTAMENIPAFRDMLFVPMHPLIKHWVAILQNQKTTAGEEFKYAMAELGRLLFYEASRDCLLTVAVNVKSPMGVASGQAIDSTKPIVIVPMLRAGLALAEHAASALPPRKTYHLGISRDEKTSQLTVYLNKLTERFPEGSLIFLVDPMLATGDTVVAALKLIKERGADNENIKVISAIVAPDALEQLRKNFSGVKVYAGAFNEEVNDDGFIVPGLGDAEERCFGT